MVDESKITVNLACTRCQRGRLTVVSVVPRLLVGSVAAQGRFLGTPWALFREK